MPNQSMCLPFLWAADIMLVQGEQKTRKGVTAACLHEKKKQTLTHTRLYVTCVFCRLHLDENSQLKTAGEQYPLLLCC